MTTDFILVFVIGVLVGTIAAWIFIFWRYAEAWRHADSNAARLAELEARWAAIPWKLLEYNAEMMGTEYGWLSGLELKQWVNANRPQEAQP